MQEEQAERFGKWLRERRQEAGMSTTQLAKMAETTDGTIVRIEQGKISAPAPDKLSRIAAALDLSLADVYAMAGYAVPGDLPTFQPYLRRKYRDMPVEAIEDLDEAFARIVRKHGYEPDGPLDSEDEYPEVASIN
jgi:transcriptional regulator with XRE-family HTH domain